LRAARVFEDWAEKQGWTSVRQLATLTLCAAC
jgi:hypothetical protein